MTHLCKPDTQRLEVPFEVVLVKPEIAPNVGSTVRTCAAFGVPLHIVGQVSFSMNHAKVRRTGVDTWAQSELHWHNHLSEVVALTGGRVVAFMTKGKQMLPEFSFKAGDLLVFGPEQSGLAPEDLKDCLPSTVKIPHGSVIRSLNLSTCVGIGAYAAACSLQSWQHSYRQFQR